MSREFVAFQFYCHDVYFSVATDALTHVTLNYYYVSIFGSGQGLTVQYIFALFSVRVGWHALETPTDRTRQDPQTK